jgi:CheY-like chemotaxis protein
MPHGGTLRIESDEIAFEEQGARAREVQPGRYVRLRVRDTGVGMDRETCARIFEPFFTTKGVGRGTGLGLATVFAIVSQMQGSVEVESTPGQGTVFTFHLPRCPAYLDDPAAAPPDAGALSGTALLVEDDPLVRMAIHNSLQELGLEVIEARSPERALEICDALERPVELLVTDVMMPGMVGPRLAARLRERHPTLGVLFVSAHTVEELIERGTVEPGAVVLCKPFQREALAACLRDVLRARHEAGEPDAQA